jgi:hypothetical protein
VEEYLTGAISTSIITVPAHLPTSRTFQTLRADVAFRRNSSKTAVAVRRGRPAHLMSRGTIPFAEIQLVVFFVSSARAPSVHFPISGIVIYRLAFQCPVVGAIAEALAHWSTSIK